MMSIFQNEYNFLKDKRDVLRAYCKKYKLKVTGNKSVLSQRLKEFVQQTVACRSIQRIYRGYLTRVYMQSKYGCYNTVNDEEFVSLEPIKTFRIHDLFVVHENGFNYAFTISSLLKLLSTKATNPYTRNMFSTKVGPTLLKHIKIGKSLSIDLDLNVESIDMSVLNREIRLSNKTTQLFSSMDSHGYITDTEWFLTLTHRRSMRFIRELMDIWKFRLGIDMALKNRIIPTGDPFTNISIYRISEYDIVKLKFVILNIIDKFVNSGVDQSYKYMGTTYVLMALTLVNHNAANALPWLYESVAVIR